MNLEFTEPQNLGSLLMKSSQSNFDLRSPSSFLVRSQLIATVTSFCEGQPNEIYIEILYFSTIFQLETSQAKSQYYGRYQCVGVSWNKIAGFPALFNPPHLKRVAVALPLPRRGCTFKWFVKNSVHLAVIMSFSLESCSKQ